MERINRDNYLSILKNFKDQQIIKVITGIRRCGKSTLLEIYQDYLRDIGVEDNNNYFIGESNILVYSEPITIKS